MELTTYPQVGQKCRFDPYQETGGMGGLLPTERGGKFGMVTGEIIYVNLPHKWFLAQYGEESKRISFKFCDIGKLVTVKGMKMPKPEEKKPLPHLQSAAKAVICVTTGKTYPSIIEAAKDTGLSPSSVATCCRGVVKQARGMQFRFAEGAKK